MCLPTINCLVVRAVQLGSIDNGGCNKRYLVKPSPFGPVRRVAIIPPAAEKACVDWCLPVWEYVFCYCVSGSWRRAQFWVYIGMVTAQKTEYIHNIGTLAAELGKSANFSKCATVFYDFQIHRTKSHA